MSYFAQLSQNVTLPAALQSTANINAGATYTSSYASTLSVAGIQVNLSADQNCTIYVDQSSDGITADAGTDNFTIYAGTPYGYTIQATSAYVRIRVKNKGLVATTSLILVTALCPMVEALPRSLDDEGHLQIAVHRMTGDFGQNYIIDQMRALKVAESTRLIGSHFAVSALETNFWTNISTGTGTATVGTGKLLLSTGITTASLAAVQSVRSARFVFSMPNYFRGSVICPAVTGANIRRWGAFDANNGYFFELDTGTYRVVTRRSGVDLPVSTGSFNGKTGLSYTIDTNQHAYEIYWLATGVYFFIDGYLLHSIPVATNPLVDLLSLPIGLHNLNGANTNNNTMQVLGATICRLGNLLTQPMSQRISTLTTTTLKQSAGNLHSIIFGIIPTAAGTITIYDNTSATGTIIWSASVRTPATTTTPISVDFKGVPFSTGLTIVTGTNAIDFTVVYE